MYFLLATFLLSSCGELRKKFGRSEEGMTKVSFAAENGDRDRFSAMTLSGGLMIFLVGANSQGPKRTVKFLDEGNANSSSVSLPNGDYLFMAVGFTGTNMTGDMRCGKVQKMLSGGATTVPITMTIANCDTDEFRPSSGTFYDATYGVRRWQFVSCRKTVADATLNGFTGGSICNSGGQPGSIFHLRSAKIFLPGYNFDGSAPGVGQVDINQGLSSGCMTGTGTPTDAEAYGTSGTGVSAVATLSSGAVVFGSGSTIKYSTDGGTTFATATGVTLTTIESIKGVGSTFYAVGAGGLNKSTDSGATWSSVYAGSFNSVTANTAGTKIWIGNSIGHVYRSTDSGATFSDLGAVGALTSYVNGLAYDNSTGTLFAGGAGIAAIYRSTNDGTSFASPTSCLVDTNEIAASGGNTYAACSGGLKLSYDDGVTWANANSGPPAAYGVTISNGMVFVGSNASTTPKIYYHDLGDNSIWSSSSYSSAASGNATKVAAYKNRVFFTVPSDGSASARATDGYGDGAAFPGVTTSLIPAGGTGSIAPFATMVKVYENKDCTGEGFNYFFPRGLGQATPAGENAVIKANASYMKIFLRDL